MNEKDEVHRKSLQQLSAQKHELLEASVMKRIRELEIVHSSISSFGKNNGIDLQIDVQKTHCGPHCGRDASLALAWYEVNYTAISTTGELDPILKEEFQVNHIKIFNEITFLSRLVLAAKVVAHVTSPHHKKLLNLCFNWLSTFLPHCLAKINRVSFGLLSSADCKAALEADPHVPRSRLKLGVPFIGKV